MLQSPSTKRRDLCARERKEWELAMGLLVSLFAKARRMHPDH